MTAELAVELSDLNGWATQVEPRREATPRPSGSSPATSPTATSAPILELITAAYEGMIPSFHGVLDADGDRLDADRVRPSRRSRRTTARPTPGSPRSSAAARRSPTTAAAGGFSDVASAVPSAPSSGGAELPEVSFGAIFDTVCDVIAWIGGPDPREYVTRWIVGDIGKAGMHASSWEARRASALKAVERNLASGAAAIGKTWQGQAATASAAQIDQWVAALGEQAAGMSQVGRHLRRHDQPGPRHGPGRRRHHQDRHQHGLGRAGGCLRSRSSARPS